MAKSFLKLKTPARWQLLNAAARRGAADAGFEVARRPGRGMSNIWELRKGGVTRVASVRTSRDRYIAFPPLDQGTRWKTLDDVDDVLVAVVDSKENPQRIEVYLLPAEEVRDRFNRSYRARTQAGHVISDDFGMWLSLDADKRDLPSSVGTGIVDRYKPLGRYDVEELLSGAPKHVEVDGPTTDDHDDEEEGDAPPAVSSIGDVMKWARERISEFAGVSVESVKLDLKIEY